ncbi:hypothetical protein EDC18_102399 [Natranaerovirga pectinivora]|uniref:Uncharacterized protein n=1 Tax=Natranaerovirga pectinivora TaxID=682400 RepID=A0A4R3MP82_9FIRM|nr:hypothetical protein [Natranaerovirga pectinivora]TCT16380.1 hypothetical protein EDC18_102399 [Natranaerovirga pectinivora]
MKLYDTNVIAHLKLMDIQELEVGLETNTNKVYYLFPDVRVDLPNRLSHKDTLKFMEICEQIEVMKKSKKIKEVA